MDDFKVECYITGEDDHDIRLCDLHEQDIREWKKQIEERALSEYYNKKIEVKEN